LGGVDRRGFGGLRRSKFGALSDQKSKLKGQKKDRPSKSEGGAPTGKLAN
jgi:hypothetical protein